MGKSFFIWNGIDCRNMGVTLAGPVPIIRPEERVKHVEIPGRSGDLTLVEGSNIYNSYIQTATIQVRGGYHARDVWKWLRGDGYVTFSGEPNVRQKARIIGAITLDKHSHNLDIWTGEVQFYCQPLKETLEDKVAVVTSLNTSVNNDGDVDARPLYRITASGSTTTLTVTGTGTASDNSITVNSLQTGWIFWVDSETCEVWNTQTTALITSYSEGNFPVMAPGANTIGGSGWSRIEIVKRERFL